MVSDFQTDKILISFRHLKNVSVKLTKLAVYFSETLHVEHPHCERKVVGGSNSMFAAFNLPVTMASD